MIKLLLAGIKKLFWQFISWLSKLFKKVPKKYVLHRFKVSRKEKRANKRFLEDLTNTVMVNTAKSKFKSMSK